MVVGWDLAILVWEVEDITRFGDLAEICLSSTERVDWPTTFSTFMRMFPKTKTSDNKLHTEDYCNLIYLLFLL